MSETAALKEWNVQLRVISYVNVVVEAATETEAAEAAEHADPWDLPLTDNVSAIEVDHITLVEDITL